MFTFASTFVVIITCILPILSIKQDVQLLPIYDAFVDKCLSIKDNYLFSKKRESIFTQLFNDNKDNINKNNITNGLMFMYENKWHTQNIFHQLNWYLSHFHDIISSTSLLNIIKNYHDFNSSLNNFKIIIIYPQYNVKSYHWSCELLKTYPFKLRWGNLFKSIDVECYFYDKNNNNVLIFNQLMTIHSIPKCIKLNTRLFSLLEYKYSDWNSHHQPKYEWINEWIFNFKLIHNISSSNKCKNNKWNIGIIQRSEENRYLVDDISGNDIYEELIKNEKLNKLFIIHRVSFEQDEMSTIEQAKWINSMDIIIGVHGASLTNIIFMNQNDQYKICNNESKNFPSLVEIGFRFGWCSDYDFVENRTSDYPIFQYNLTNKQLINRWQTCHNKYYKKAEFFSLLYAISSNHRYIEINAVKYGDETDFNFIRKKEIFIDIQFLIGEIMNLYNDNSYDFSVQLDKYQHTIYAKQGMVFPGQGQNLYQTVKIIQFTFIGITVIGLILWFCNCDLIKIRIKILGTEYTIFQFN